MNNKALTILLFAIFPILTNAELIDAGLVTQDTSTGLEWLDLTETLELSVDDIEAGVGGFLGDGWRVAHVTEVDQLFLNAGWDGVDDTENNGSPEDFVVVENLLGLLGATFEGEPVFGEGWALTDLPGRVSRPFYELEGVVAGNGRIACTAAGFAARPGDGTVNFAECGMPADTQFFFIGVYLVREISSTDADSDGVADDADNCTNAANPDQIDADGDGIGNLCDADFDNNCLVTFPDLGIMQAGFFSVDAILDLDSSGGPVNFADLAIMSELFFLAPGPSATGCN